MGKSRKFIAKFLGVILCLALLVTLPVSAADLYFTALNDTVLPLSSDTMPVWSGGQLHVPLTAAPTAASTWAFIAAITGTPGPWLSCTT